MTEDEHPICPRDALGFRVYSVCRFSSLVIALVGYSMYCPLNTLCP